MSNRFPLMVLNELNRARQKHPDFDNGTQALMVITKQFEGYRDEASKPADDRNIVKVILQLVRASAMIQRYVEDVIFVGGDADHDALDADLEPFLLPAQAEEKGGVA